MPVNLPSNAHGQGYSDLNFIIPELVQTIAYEKGTYYAPNGDFSAAGAAQFHLMDALDQGFVKMETGQDDYLRLVAADSFGSTGGAATTVALEYGYSNGPVQTIAYEKGTYYAPNGNFSAAGAAQFHLMDALDQGFVKMETGQDD